LSETVASGFEDLVVVSGLSPKSCWVGSVRPLVLCVKCQARDAPIAIRILVRYGIRLVAGAEGGRTVGLKTTP
jgi:hypothetical protein